MARRVLLVTEMRFWRGGSGAAERAAALCRGLQRAGHQVAVYFPDRLKGDDAMLLQSSFPDVTVHTPGLLRVAQRGVRRRIAPLFGIAGAGESSLPEALARPWCKERIAGFAGACASFQPDAVIVEYLVMSEVLDARPRAKTIIDTIDILHERAQGGASCIGITAEQETEILNHYDAILAIQRGEYETLRRLCPERPVLLTPHPVAVTPLPSRPGDKVRLLFVGGEARHNTEAIRWFLEQVWPGVRASAPDIELHIAGSVCDALEPDEGVTLLGRVESIEQTYRDTDIALNPARSGSGLKIKNVEALGYGRPLITSSIGAAGMEEGGGRAFLVADSPEEWHDAVLQLAREPEDRDHLGAEAAAYARRHFSEAAAYAPLLDFIEHA